MLIAFVDPTRGLSRRTVTVAPMIPTNAGRETGILSDDARLAGEKIRVESTIRPTARVVSLPAILVDSKSLSESPRESRATSCSVRRSAGVDPVTMYSVTWRACGTVSIAMEANPAWRPASSAM
jgi:hypothetical protein